LIISLIVAMDQRQGIGYQGSLPWHLSSDLKRFKSLTMGHTLIMGRKTYESIGKPLPGREMIVISRNPEYQVSGSLIFSSLNLALDYTRNKGEKEVFVIGGGDVFRQALYLADRIYLTRVDAETLVDTYFPKFDSEEWHETESRKIIASIGDDYDYSFSVFERISPADK
jgi:dihydrofolate reductase